MRPTTNENARVSADIERIHLTLDEIVEDPSLNSSVRDAIDALRIALDSNELSESTVAEMLNALEPTNE